MRPILKAKKSPEGSRQKYLRSLSMGGLPMLKFTLRLNCKLARSLFRHPKAKKMALTAKSCCKSRRRSGRVSGLVEVLDAPSRPAEQQEGKKGYRASPDGIVHHFSLLQSSSADTSARLVAPCQIVLSHRAAAQESERTTRPLRGGINSVMGNTFGGGGFGSRGMDAEVFADYWVVLGNLIWVTWWGLSNSPSNDPYCLQKG